MYRRRKKETRKRGIPKTRKKRCISYSIKQSCSSYYLKRSSFKTDLNKKNFTKLEKQVIKNKNFLFVYCSKIENIMFLAFLNLRLLVAWFLLTVAIIKLLKQLNNRWQKGPFPAHLSCLSLSSSLLSSLFSPSAVGFAS